MNVTKNLTDWEIEEYEALLHILSAVHLNDNRDLIVWNLKKQGEFPVKSFYNHLVGRVEVGLDRFLANQI